VLDAGCGRGSALLAMAERFRQPLHRLRLCADAIATPRRVAERGLGNMRFAARDLTGYDAEARFDLVTSFDAVHDQKDPQG
jgi:cyclopropane fatty-acyl-phospholipid synthase-like methyltransferase